jgi:hypothetical protein
LLEALFGVHISRIGLILDLVIILVPQLWTDISVPEALSIDVTISVAKKIYVIVIALTVYTSYSCHDTVYISLPLERRGHSNGEPFHIVAGEERPRSWGPRDREPGVGAQCDVVAGTRKRAAHTAGREALSGAAVVDGRTIGRDVHRDVVRHARGQPAERGCGSGMGERAILRFEPVAEGRVAVYHEGKGTLARPGHIAKFEGHIQSRASGAARTVDESAFRLDLAREADAHLSGGERGGGKGARRNKTGEEMTRAPGVSPARGLRATRVRARF